MLGKLAKALDVPVTPLLSDLTGREPRTATMSDEKAKDPKFVQITTSVHGGEILLYALDESGAVWRFDDKTRQWVKLPRDRR